MPSVAERMAAMERRNNGEPEPAAEEAAAKPMSIKERQAAMFKAQEVKEPTQAELAREKLFGGGKSVSVSADGGMIVSKRGGKLSAARAMFEQPEEPEEQGPPPTEEEERAQVVAELTGRYSRFVKAAQRGVPLGALTPKVKAAGLDMEVLQHLINGGSLGGDAEAEAEAEQQQPAESEQQQQQPEQEEQGGGEEEDDRPSLEEILAVVDEADIEQLAMALAEQRLDNDPGCWDGDAPSEDGMRRVLRTHYSSQHLTDPCGVTESRSCRENS